MNHNRIFVARALAALLATVAYAALTPDLSAQRAPGLAGVELRAGVVFPEQADAGLGVMGEVDLGYVWRPQLRAIAGVSRMVANIDREPGDDEGSYTATGLWLGARYDLFAQSSTNAYVRGALTIQRVGADAWDRDVDALLSGTNTGAAIAVGARRNLDAAGRLGGTFEVRRAWLNNISHTAVEIGVRWQRRGLAAYRSDPLALAPPRRVEPSTDRTDPPAPRPEPAVQTAAPQPQGNIPVEAAPEPRPLAEPAQSPEDAARLAAERARAAEANAAAAAALLRQGLNRAAASMQSASGVRETDGFFVVTLSGNTFASGAERLTAPARRELRVLATVLAGYPGHVITIDGHTDAVGDPAANRLLSAERAAAVRAGLIAEGVDPLWIAARAFGAAQPVASNDTATGRAANRRVEIRIAKQRCAEPPRPDADGAVVCVR